MKYLLSVIIIFLPVIIHAGTKPRIAILEVSSNNIEDTYSKVVRNKIEFSLYSTVKYELLERDSIQLVLKERGLTESNLENINNAIKAGKFLSANFVIIGSISFLNDYTLNIKVIDVSKGNILFVGAKNYTDKNDFIKYILLLTEEMKSAIEKAVEEPVVRQKEPNPVLFNLLLSGGASVPLFEWDSISKTGFNIRLQAYFELKKAPSFTFGLSAGYVYNELKNQFSLAHGIPILAGIGYSFRIKEILSIVPQFQAGINYSILQMNDKTWQAFEPVIAPGLVISVNLSKKFFLMVSADWSFIFETSAIIQNFNINAGIGICI